MQLKWLPGRNPMRLTSFHILGLGPNASPKDVSNRKQSLCQQVRAERQLKVAGVTLDDQAINDAHSRLMDPVTFVEESLFVHPHPPREKVKPGSALDRLHQLTEIPTDEAPPALSHPLALFWFLPAPDASAWRLPDFGSFGIPAAGSPEDRALDIVFDC